jgi:hypothetical protein
MNSKLLRLLICVTALQLTLSLHLWGGPVSADLFFPSAKVLSFYCNINENQIYRTPTVHCTAHPTQILMEKGSYLR